MPSINFPRDIFNFIKTFRPTAFSLTRCLRPGQCGGQNDPMQNITDRRKPSQKCHTNSNGFTTPSHGTKGPLWNMGHQQPCHFDQDGSIFLTCPHESTGLTCPTRERLHEFTKDGSISPTCPPQSAWKEKVLVLGYQNI